MKRTLAIAVLLLQVLCAGAQEVRCTFVQNKTVKVLNKVTHGKGTVLFAAPDRIEMRFIVPEGNYIIVRGDELKRCIKGKVFTFDLTRHSQMRKMRNTLLDCITGAYEKAARESEAALKVENKGSIKSVELTATKKATIGYAKVLVDYNKDGLPVHLILDEFTGVTTEYRFTY